MKIVDAIGLLRVFQKRGVTDVLIARDFAPGGDFTLKHFPAWPFNEVAWIEQDQDDIKELMDSVVQDYAEINTQLVAAGFPKGAIGVKELIEAHKILKDYYMD